MKTFRFVPNVVGNEKNLFKISLSTNFHKNPPVFELSWYQTNRQTGTFENITSLKEVTRESILSKYTTCIKKKKSSQCFHWNAAVTKTQKKQKFVPVSLCCKRNLTWTYRKMLNLQNAFNSHWKMFWVVWREKNKRMNTIQYLFESGFLIQPIDILRSILCVELGWEWVELFKCRIRPVRVRFCFSTVVPVSLQTVTYILNSTCSSELLEIITYNSNNWIIKLEKNHLKIFLLQKSKFKSLATS